MPFKFSIIVLTGLLFLSSYAFAQFYPLSIYLDGNDRVVDTTYVSSLPGGAITLQETQICPASFEGGTLVSTTQANEWATMVTYINNEPHFKWPPQLPDGTTMQAEGPWLTSPYQDEIPQLGRTITFNGLYSPAVLLYGVTCFYKNCTVGRPCQWNYPIRIFAINLAPPTLKNISVSSVTFVPADGTPSRSDRNGIPVISSTAKNNAILRLAVEGEISNTVLVSVTMNGTEVGSKDVVLSSSTEVVIPITASLDGLIGIQSVSVHVSAVPDESNLADNTLSTNINIMKLCKVEEKGRIVPFISQANPLWSQDDFGIIENSRKPGTIGKYGCSLTAFAMLMESFGIRRTPLGSPASPYIPGKANLDGLNAEIMTPKTLNQAFINYRTNINTIGSVALNANNDPDWMGMAVVARAGYRAQCSENPSCDPSGTNRAISFIKSKNDFDNSENSVDRQMLETELCNGKPVIAKFAKPDGGQHFMLMTGIDVDRQGNVTYRLNNPGRQAAAEGEQVLYSRIKDKYPAILGYVVYRPQIDPSMMMIAAPLNVHFVVTDPAGRRSGYDPISNVRYDEIPNADYTVQSIDTPNEEDYVSDTMVSERYFTNVTNGIVGNYKIKLFGVSNGTFYLDYRSYDQNGYSNDNIYRTGSLNAGSSIETFVQHFADPIPTTNALLEIFQYEVDKHTKKGFTASDVSLHGQILSMTEEPPAIDKDFKLSLGGLSGFTLSVPSYKFKKMGSGRVYKTSHAEIVISKSGKFEIHLNKLDLSNLLQSQIDYVSIELGSLFADKRLQLKCSLRNCSLQRKNHEKCSRHR